jgi:hypothetical protein
MTLEIVHAFPPNIAQIVDVLPAAKQPGIIFCYGQKIYNPSKVELTRPILVHEGVHAERQTDPEAWWGRYLTDPEFRFNEELPAHIAEAKAFGEDNPDRWKRRAYISLVAKKLSSPVYGNVVSFEKARAILRQA